MKNTTAGFPANVFELTTEPLTVSGSENGGISVPRGNMRGGGRAIGKAFRHDREASTASLNFTGQHRKAFEIVALVKERVGCAAGEHSLYVATRFDVRDELDPEVEVGIRALPQPALGVPRARVVSRDRQQRIFRERVGESSELPGTECDVYARPLQ